jgi:hypothetical protein
MPDAIITSTASTFGTISGTFAADQSTITGTVAGIVDGTLDGSVGVPGPQGQQGVQGIQGIQGVPGSPGAPGQGVAAGGSAGQVLQKLSATSYDTGWLTLPADYITSVTAPLAVASGNLSVNLSAYLPLAGGNITGDILSYNGSRFQTIASGSATTYSQVTPDGVVVSGGGVGGNQISIQWDGITFADGKQTVKYPGASILSGYATEYWVTTGFYPLTGNPSGFLTSASLSGYATESWVTGQGYITSAALTPYITSATATASFYPLTGNPSGFLTSAPVTSVAGRTGAITLANTDISGLGSLAVVNDAPSNGSQYARKNAAWDVVIPGDRYLTSSTTSNTISNGNKTFTIGTGLSYTPTQNITISYDASKHMHGEVLTYNSGTGVLTVDINHHTGSGTYASWVVNVGGVTPATSVAWGAITGTLSTQTDLQNALDLKLDATTAASTYYLQTNPSGFISDAPSDGSTYGRNNGAWTVAGGSSLITSVSSPLAVTSGDLSIDLNAYLTASALSSLTSDVGFAGGSAAGRLFIDGLYDPSSSGFTSARLNFGSSTPSQPSNGDFWTDGTYFKYTLGSVTSNVASQSFVTGQGYITSSAVPAFATTEQAALNSSATTLISPANYRVAGLTTNVWAGTASGLSSIVLGTGANIGSGYTILNGRLLAPNAATAGYASRGFTLSTGSNAATAGVNYGTASGHAVRVYSGSWGSTVAGVKMRGVFGRRGGSIPAPAPLAERGYGWEWDFSSRTMRILAHNGTTLTNPSVTWNPIISRTYEIMVTSNGAGTISLYIDNALIGTTTGGPNDLVGNSAPVWWQLEIQNEVTAGGQTDLLFQNPKLYNTNG